MRRCTDRSVLGRARVLGPLMATIALFAPSYGARTAAAQMRLTVPEALRLAFPEPAEIERRTAFLEEEQLEEARRLAGRDVEVDHSVVTYYVGLSDDEPLGVAYFDSHRVRTLSEVLMFVVSTEARIQRIETVRFSEPPEYRAPDAWYEQFYDAELDDDLSTKGSIINMTGATLTSVAVTRAARRILALHQVIRPFAVQHSKGSR